MVIVDASPDPVTVPEPIELLDLLQGPVFVDEGFAVVDVSLCPSIWCERHDIGRSPRFDYFIASIESIFGRVCEVE